ncbi:MAG: hypothetical protein FJ077_04195 [Cyanobacteria bacterium K_DeepCast_35m_m2_023]|nr:hypothetical protein [Cyanobacteria bacterium K_DeepCast_35m_m2_023]
MSKRWGGALHDLVYGGDEQRCDSRFKPGLSDWLCGALLLSHGGTNHHGTGLAGLVWQRRQLGLESLLRPAAELSPVEPRSVRLRGGGSCVCEGGTRDLMGAALEDLVQMYIAI